MDNKNDNSRGHNYANIHMHDHDHDFIHFEIPATTVKDLALLEYMLEHNRQHAHELADLGIRLADEGFSVAAQTVNDAIKLFSQANDYLGNAIAQVNESGKLK